MERRVLSGLEFRCQHLDACRESHLSHYRKGAASFYEGQLHHVGKHYDLSMNGTPLRIAVSGQEYGGAPRFVSREERSESVVVRTGLQRRFRTEGNFPHRNSHMRGTTSLLRLLFGRPAGVDYPSEFIEVNGEKAHVFETFALLDYLLCSAVSAPEDLTGGRYQSSGTGKSTTLMRRNCASHFRRTIEILEPSVLVLQGKTVVCHSVRNYRIFDRLDSISECLAWGHLGAHKCLVAFFTHPSAHTPGNWGNNDRTPYLRDVVAPNVGKIHNLLGLNTEKVPLDTENQPRLVREPKKERHRRRHARKNQ